MSKWDRRMLGLVNLVATWSKDPSTGVGAVIVDAKNRVVSLGRLRAYGNAIVPQVAEQLIASYLECRP